MNGGMDERERMDGSEFKGEMDEERKEMEMSERKNEGMIGIMNE